MIHSIESLGLNKIYIDPIIIRDSTLETEQLDRSASTKLLIIMADQNNNNNEDSRAPIYHTRWQHRAFYNNTNHTHTHIESDEGMGRAVKNSSEIIIKQVRLEGGFERGGRIRVAECLRQTVPDRWARIRKRPFTKCFCVYTEGGKGSCVRCRS